MSIHTSTAQDNELAQQAYASVRNISTVEPNDRNRLGYHVWLFLRGELPSLEEAVKQARSRVLPRTRTIEDLAEEIGRELEAIKQGTVDLSTTNLFPTQPSE